MSPLGTLFVVATPIGNLEDASPRALSVLRTVARIACEDTRRTAKLLHRYGVETRTVSCHEFNERARLLPLLDLLRQGQDVALVSDAGTPTVSDPGALLVRAALDAGVRVVPVPGPSAALALVSASGLPADRFVFEGYLPARAGERRRRLRQLRAETRTVVVYEAPHRIRRTLEDVSAILGGREIVLGRELTKIHETILRGTAREVLSALGGSEARGEITLAIAGGKGATAESESEAERVREAWRAALRASKGDTRAALKEAARALGMKRPSLYRLLLELGEPVER